MNNAKFDGVLYPVRETDNLRDIIKTSVKEFADKNAYLVKDKHGEPFRPITYAQVGEDIDALGTEMISMGLQGEKIGVIGDTCYEWLLTYFATVSGVGAIVPLDRKLPPDELKSLVRRSGIKALVYNKKAEKIVKEIFDEPYEIEYFISMNDRTREKRALAFSDLLEKGREKIEEGDRSFLDATVDPDELSTLMFTSGTTGMAKGVMLSHRNIAANVKNMSKLVHLEENMVILSILPVHHAYEMTCVIWTTFFQGKTIAICEGIRYIQKNMVEVGAGCMVGVPLVFEKMYKGMWKQAKSRGEAEKLRKAIDFSRKFKLYNNRRLMQKMFKAIHQNFGGNMKLFIAGGAAIDPKVIEDFEAMGLPMIQGYGMSENGPIIAVNQDRYSVPASVGRPMPETEIKIIDADEDGIGEVLVKGPSVMMGYYNNEEATNEALQNGWLHTGDLGYIDAKGFLYITGRKKTVIVTKGGKNIFPEEIEAVLLENELIKEVLVHGVTDKKVGNTIIAADIFPNYTLLKKQKGDMNSGEIYNFYRELIDDVNDELPPYKVIKRINIRDKEFEKTTTGKIKRYGNFTVDSENDRGLPEQTDQKKIEKEDAEKVIKEIVESPDRFIRYRDMKAITDVKQMFENSASIYRDRVAFRQRFKGEDDVTDITYADTLIDVNGLGTALLNRGLEGKSIGIIGEMCYEWCTAYLAVIGGTGTVVPIDSNFNRNDIERIIDDADIACVFCTREYKGLLESIADAGNTGLELIVDLRGREKTLEEKALTVTWRTLVAEGKAQVARGDRQFIDADIISSKMAAIHYTTGEHGRFKGVMLSNRGITENLMKIPSLVGINKEDVILSAFPGHHAFECTCGFLLPLYRGATIAINSGRLSLEKNLEYFKPTILIGSPHNIEHLYKLMLGELYHDGRYARFNSIAEGGWFKKTFSGRFMRTIKEDLNQIVGGRMRLVASFGDVIDDSILEFLGELEITAVEGYGLTEFSPVAAINPDDRGIIKKGSAGKLLPGTEIKIANPDEEGNGEICLRGTNLMLGYYHNEKATADNIIDGWLHTGDFGKCDQDGFLFIEGRRKSMFTDANGRTVFPEAMESRLRTLYYIKDAMVWADEKGSLAATVVIDRDAVEDVLEEEYDEESASALVGERIYELNRKNPENRIVDTIILRERDFEKTTGGKIRRDVLANREV